MTLLEYLSKKKVDISFLQEMHTDIGNQTNWLADWRVEIFLGHGSTESAGVAILFAVKMESDSVVMQEVVPGGFLTV